VRSLDDLGKPVYTSFHLQHTPNSRPVKASAHPFFVTYFSDNHLLDQDVEPKVCSDEFRRIIAISGVWQRAAPPEFSIGPDVWREHRHPLSGNGSCVRRLVNINQIFVLRNMQTLMRRLHTRRLGTGISRAYNSLNQQPHSGSYRGASNALETHSEVSHT